MDEQQYQYFLQRYANMSDEELSYLIVSRSGSLAEEAEHALRTVLAGRNSDSFNQELAATANDQEAQFRHDEALAREATKNAAHLRKTIHLFFGALVVVSLLIGLAGWDALGWPLAGMGASVMAFYELQRLSSRFWRALFDPNSS